MATISCDYYSTSYQLDGDTSNEGTVVNYVLRDHIDRGMVNHPVCRKGAGKHAAVGRHRELAGAGGAASKEIQVIYEGWAYEESQQNAHAERAIREVEGAVRTPVCSCEDMHDGKSQPDHPLRTWAVECVGQLLSWAQASTRDSRLEWEYRWDAGIYMGLAEETNQIQESTPGGALRVHSVKRLSLAQRRDPELVTVVVGLPREMMYSGEPRPQRVSVSFAPVVPEEEAPARTQPRREEAAPRE